MQVIEGCSSGSYGCCAAVVGAASWRGKDEELLHASDVAAGCPLLFL
jgi:hypothetical protein